MGCVDWDAVGLRVGGWPGYRGMLQIQRLYCVLHASRRYEGTMMDAEECYEFDVCTVFYMLRGDIGVTLA